MSKMFAVLSRPYRLHVVSMRSWQAIGCSISRPNVLRLPTKYKLPS